MHCVAPRNVLGQKWWDQTRQSAYESTSFHCLACGVWKHDAEYRHWLEAHELYNINYARGRMVYVESVPLCTLCHAFIHDGRLQALLEQGKITHQRYSATIRHGTKVLGDAGLKRSTHDERDKVILLNGIADWASWKLIIDVVIDGKKVHKEVGPRFKSFEEWEIGMGLQL